MTTTTTYAPFPPQGTQIAIGTGTLTGVVVQSTNNTPGDPAQGFVNSGSAALKATFYDSNTGPTDTPLVSIDTANGYQPITLNLSFEHGLYIEQHSGCSIAVATT